MPDAPAQSYALLRKFIPSSLQPFLRGLKKRYEMPLNLEEPYSSVFSYTQAHPLRQENLLRLANLVEANSIPGAIVECGVLDGGTAALMAYGTQKLGCPVHLFDSWEGLPETTEEDGDGMMWSGQVVGSPKRVVSIMRKLGIDPDRLHFHKGWFSDTFPKAQIDRIALLHVDGDFYDSVKSTLETWTPKMSPGGFIQIDDYEIFKGCTKAVDEFLSTRPDLRLEFVDRQAKAFYIRMP